MINDFGFRKEQTHPQIISELFACTAALHRDSYAGFFFFFEKQNSLLPTLGCFRYSCVNKTIKLALISISYLPRVSLPQVRNLSSERIRDSAVRLFMSEESRDFSFPCISPFFLLYSCC